MHLRTDRHIYIYIYIYIYTNIAESQIERDYWPRYAHAARQLTLFIAIVTGCPDIQTNNLSQHWIFVAPNELTLINITYGGQL